jgi:hypothetical protein
MSVIAPSEIAIWDHALSVDVDADRRSRICIARVSNRTHARLELRTGGVAMRACVIIGADAASCVLANCPSEEAP